jgi:hypothetical protein
MIAEEDNITREMTKDGRLVYEPGFAAYLRNNGYAIDDIHSVDTVQSRSEEGKKYLVAKIDTYELPRNHDDLDVVADTITIPTCTCWPWRNKSPNLEDGYRPQRLTCPHLEMVYKELRAENDENQDTLL